jgi:hypothetical protein
VFDAGRRRRDNGTATNPENLVGDDGLEPPTSSV